MTPFRIYLWALTALTVIAVAVVPIPFLATVTGHGFRDIERVQLRSKVIGYSREQFGDGWATQRSGCTTREEAMATAYGMDSCSAPYSLWGPVSIADPYTGEDLPPFDVEIDHVYPLSAAWDMGAHAWPEDKRLAFANDPANLIVTSSTANRAKSDMLPGEWMPPDRSYGCEYSQRLSVVASAYSLPLTADDISAMRRACSRLIP